MSKYKVKNSKLLEFVNMYEPLWFELCDVYNLGNKSECNNITKRELATLDLEVVVERLNEEQSYLTAIVKNDNDCIILEDMIESDGADSFSDYIEFFEEIID